MITKHKVPKLTRVDMIRAIWTKTGYPYDQIEQIINTAFEEIQDALVDGKFVEFREFLTAYVHVAKARIGRNPFKPDSEIVIPPRPKLKVRLSKPLRKRLDAVDLVKFDRRKLDDKT